MGTLKNTLLSFPERLFPAYDQDGSVLLGYIVFMDNEDDHHEVPDDTGYFRISDWHSGFLHTTMAVSSSSLGSYALQWLSYSSAFRCRSIPSAKFNAW